MRSQLLEIISECDGMDHYTERQQNYALDRMLTDLQRIDNLDRVHAMNLSNRISNRDRDAARRLVSMSRTPPERNPHDPSESVLDIASPEPLARVGCPGYEDEYMPTCKGSVLFWPVMLAVAYVVAWGLLMWGGR